jgi:hypothetical protein
VRFQPKHNDRQRWLNHFTKLSPDARQVWGVVTSDPQWKGPLWYRMFRDIQRAGLSWMTSYRGFFKNGLRIENIYRPHIHAILKQHKIPLEMAALPFVESMYNPWARSFVGALGLWQIMPATGRELALYISPAQYNSSYLPLLDERHDPLLATHAAARFLLLCRHFFRDSWPLALTSYNQGPGRILNLVRRYRTRDLPSIIYKANVREFGPDGRNFYAKFIAAVLALRDAKQFFPKTQYAPLRYQELHLPQPLWFDDILRVTGLTAEQIIRYNPMLRGFSRPGSASIHPVPQHFPLRLTPKRVKSTNQAIAKLIKDGGSMRTYYSQSRESLTLIARRHLLSTDLLLKTNPSLQPQLPTCAWPPTREHLCANTRPKCLDPLYKQYNRQFPMWFQRCSKEKQGKKASKKSYCSHWQRLWMRRCQQHIYRQTQNALTRRLAPKTPVQIPAWHKAAPSDTRLGTYRIRGNEPLSWIACQNCTTIWHLRQLNPELEIKRIPFGTTLRVPLCTRERRRLFFSCHQYHYQRASNKPKRRKHKR